MKETKSAQIAKIQPKLSIRSVNNFVKTSNKDIGTTKYSYKG